MGGRVARPVVACAREVVGGVLRGPISAAGFGIGGENDGADVAAEEVMLRDALEALEGRRAEVDVDGGEEGVGKGGCGFSVALAAGQTEIEKVFFWEKGCDVLNELGR